MCVLQGRSLLNIFQELIFCNTITTSTNAIASFLVVPRKQANK